MNLFLGLKVYVRANDRTIFCFSKRFAIRKYGELIAIRVDNLACLVRERDFFQPIRVVFLRLYVHGLRWWWCEKENVRRECRC